MKKENLGMNNDMEMYLQTHFQNDLRKIGVKRIPCLDTCRYCDRYHFETGTTYFGDGDNWIDNIERNIDMDKQKYFVMCLFIINLIDSAMFTYCRDYYRNFREKTNYPKFGNTGFGFCLFPPNKILSQAESHNLISNSSITEDEISMLAKIFINDCERYFKANTFNISIVEFIGNISTDRDMLRAENGIVLRTFVTNLQNYLMNNDNQRDKE